MKTRKGLRRQLNIAEREIIRLQNAVSRLETENELLRGNLSAMNQEKEAALASVRKSHETENSARELVDKLLWINDVLCADLQACDRCIDTIKLGLEQNSARAALLNRIAGPLA